MVSRTSTDHTSALPSIYIPPWAGGVSLWRGPLGVRGANPPPVGPRRPHNLAPLVSMTISRKRTTNVSHGSRHFHQLFRQLRLENRTMRDGIQWDLGHCDDLLGNCSVEELEDVHQLVAAQERRDRAPARARRTRSSAPRCAAGSALAAPAARPDRSAAYPTRRLPHRTARRTPCPRPHWSSTCSTWPPWSLPCSVPVGRRAARAFPPTPP